MYFPLEVRLIFACNGEELMAVKGTSPNVRNFNIKNPRIQHFKWLPLDTTPYRTKGDIEKRQSHMKKLSFYWFHENIASIYVSYIDLYDAP